MQATTEQVAARPASVLRAWARGMRPEEAVSTADWVGGNLVVPDGPRAGQLFDLDLAPYIRGIYEALDDESVNLVAVRKSAQVAFTAAGMGWIGARIATAPSRGMVIFPTLTSVQDFNREKLAPTIEATKALRDRIIGQKSRSSDGSTSLSKRYPGGSLTLTGANSSSDLRSKSTQFQFRDEIDEWPLDLEKQGDPMKMADARLISFHATADWKVLVGSTPTNAGTSRIDQFFEDGDQRYWNVTCPHCDTEQVLEFGGKAQDWGLKFKTSFPHEAHYICRAHGCVIYHTEKAAMVRGGRWVAREPGPGRYPSFHIDALISLLTTWDKMVEEFLDAKDDPQKLKGFVNLWLGRSWEERGDAPDHSQLMLRREDYPARTIPPGGLLHTLGADVQMNGIYYEVVTYGQDRQSWSIDARFLSGDTSDVGMPVWKEFREVLERTYPDAYGNQWPVDVAGIDSGYRTNTVYQFCVNHHRLRATKGDDGWHKPAIASSPSQQQITFLGRRRGVKLWHIGTWPLKAALYQDLRKTGLKDGEEATPPGYCHFSEHVNDEAYFRQLTAEYLKQEERSGRLRHRWVETGPNHFLDCRIIARAMAEHLQIGRLTSDDWAKIIADRCSVKTPQGDMFDARPQPRQTTEEAFQTGTQTAAAPLGRYRQRKMRTN